jgi:outer membrane protein
MKMKFLATAALVLISGTSVWAQATKIAVIDMQQAIANTNDGKAQIAELQKKYTPKEQEFQRRSQEIQSKQDQLKKTANTISDEARATLDADIKRLSTSLQRDSDDAQQDSEQDQQKMLQDVGGKIMQVITKYASENQIMIVFDLSSQPNNLVCCSSAPDITREVIAAYDKVNVPGAAASTPASKPASAPARPPTTPTTSVPRPPATSPNRPSGSTTGK